MSKLIRAFVEQWFDARGFGCGHPQTTLDALVSEITRTAAEVSLEFAGGNKDEAAAHLGITPKRLEVILWTNKG